MKTLLRDYHFCHHEKRSQQGLNLNFISKDEFLGKQYLASMEFNFLS